MLGTMVDTLQQATKASSSPIRGIATSQQQQIIVIPQSLLTQATSLAGIGKKPMLRVSPSIMTKTVQQQQQQVQPKISLKRPSSDDTIKCEKLNANGQPVRKRANLDHMTAEEKLQRRKLKNRVAAQNARDKKRARMEDMEDMIRKLEDESFALREENERLREANECLQKENNTLRQGGQTGRREGGPAAGGDIKEEIIMPPSPESLPRSPLPTQSHQDQTIVVSRPSEPAEPANSDLLPQGRGRELAVRARRAAEVSSAICLLWTCLQAAAATPAATAKLLSNASSSSNKPDQQKILPLKKRSTNWWGPEQQCSNPAAKTTT